MSNYDLRHAADEECRCCNDVRAYLAAQKVGHCEGCDNCRCVRKDADHDCVLDPGCVPCPGLAVPQAPPDGVAEWLRQQSQRYANTSARAELALEDAADAWEREPNGDWKRTGAE